MKFDKSFYDCIHHYMPNENAIQGSSKYSAFKECRMHDKKMRLPSLK